MLLYIKWNQCRPQYPHPRAQKTAVDPPVQRGESDARAVWTPQPRRADRVHHGLTHLDQTLGAHFHVHCVIAAGALATNGERWIEAAPRFLFPVRALSTVFRGKFCAALAQAGATGAVLLPEGFAQLRDQLYAHEWVVYAKAPFAGPAQVLDLTGCKF